MRLYTNYNYHTNIPLHIIGMYSYINLCFTDSELLNIAVASPKYCGEISISFEVGTYTSQCKSWSLLSFIRL